ncbi:helix-turn-helix transcriptional regulator [Paracoccus simplex]|uniref:Autoinducer binding domain-containing protein n=1 Tax=Paracoccus simplex TaxID=2086346 RepID=A0ABV7RZA0_9RHOB
MLNDIQTILAARSAEAVWRHYVGRLAGLGFPHVSYYGARLLEASGERMIDDSIFLSSYSPRLFQEILAQGGFESVPMYRWMTQSTGSESWAWMHRRRLAGRLTRLEERIMDLFARHGHASGYAVSLSDSVQRVRAGVLLSGAIGMRQDGLDAVWRRCGQGVEALTGLMHLRLSTLPYTPPETMLTLRQREVLEHIAAGRTTPEIAEMLDLTPATVEKHLRLARKALGARTTAQAILHAAHRRQIFIDPGEPCNQAEGGAQSARSGAEPWRFLSFAEALPRDRVVLDAGEGEI